MPDYSHCRVITTPPPDYSPDVLEELSLAITGQHLDELLAELRTQDIYKEEEPHETD